MPRRNPYRGLLIDVPRTGNNPEQIARAILPDRQRGRALEVLGNRLRLISVGSALQNLEDNWYMLITDRTIIYAYAPQSGVNRVEFDRINIAARTSTTPVPWADETAKIVAMGDKLHEAFRARFH
ncbi:MAG TPA: hypothetical protein VJM46_02765 [Candidatus Saccharimonadales bacterium]|nr:hypothetical protein [Candidatus Saccharimonadales bacterium]